MAMVRSMHTALLSLFLAAFWHQECMAASKGEEGREERVRRGGREEKGRRTVCERGRSEESR
eukprot:2375305-Rhodomonas_salina.2